MGKYKTTLAFVKEPTKKIAKKAKKYTTKRVQGMLDSKIGAGFLREGKKYNVPVPTKRFKKSVSGKVRDKFAQFKNVVLQKRKRKNPTEDIEPGYGQPSKRTRMHTSYENYKKTKRPDYEFESYNKGGIRKGKDFVKNMEKLKKIYGGKIPKSLTIEEADKALKKVTPIKKKSGGTASKKKKDSTLKKIKRVRDTILLAPEAVEIGKDILLNLPMKKGGMKKLKPIPADNKGLPNLPKAVRNRMGYMKVGGTVKAKCKLGKNKPTKLL